MLFKRGDTEGREGGAENERQRSEGFVFLLFYVFVCLFACLVVSYTEPSDPERSN